MLFAIDSQHMQYLPIVLLTLYATNQHHRQPGSDDGPGFVTRWRMPPRSSTLPRRNSLVEPAADGRERIARVREAPCR